MTYIPALDALRGQHFGFYVGEPIRTVSLWMRYDTGQMDEPELAEDYSRELPIWANTRGQGVWFSESTDVSNSDWHDPTDAFWEALGQIMDEDVDWIDVEDCEWYERECVHSLIGMLEEEAMTPEMYELLQEGRRSQLDVEGENA